MVCIKINVFGLVKLMVFTLLKMDTGWLKNIACWVLKENIVLGLAMIRIRLVGFRFKV